MTTQVCGCYSVQKLLKRRGGFPRNLKAVDRSSRARTFWLGIPRPGAELEMWHLHVEGGARADGHGSVLGIGKHKREHADLLVQWATNFAHCQDHSSAGRHSMTKGVA
jgi:hypothetical protein